MPPTDGLTDKQRRFCEEYLVDLNATQAAIRAGYSEDSAQQQGSENLSKPVLRSYIDELLVEARKATLATKTQAIAELTDVLRKGSPYQKCRAVEVLAKMNGWNEPEKHDHLIDAKAQVWATPPPMEKEH